MDREAVVIRSEMSQTRAALDQKIAALEARAHDYTPREYVRRHLPDYAAEKFIGSLLLLVGLTLAWKGYRR